MRCEIHDLEFVDVRGGRMRCRDGRGNLRPIMACPACVAEIRDKVRLERKRNSYWRPWRRVMPSLWSGLREFPR